MSRRRSDNMKNDAQDTMDVTCEQQGSFKKNGTEKDIDNLNQKKLKVPVTQ